MNTKSVLLKILIISLVILSIVLGGTAMYSYLEGLSFFDSFYMTVITITTTGYGDITPQTQSGKIFVMFLLLSGVGVITYSVSTILSYIVSIDFTEKRRRKMEKKVSQLKGHTIVCGFGRMGEIICKKLLEEGVTFVVVEKKDVDIRDFQKLGYNFILGDAANDEILQKAGIENAKVLISVIDNDSDGLYIALSGRSFNPDLQIIIRANEPSAQKRMMKAGADKVVLPFVMSGLKVADSVINPAVEDFLNIRGFAGSNNESELIHLADLFIPKESPLVSKSIKEVGPDLDKMLIVGIRKLDHKFVFHPGGSYTFEEGDCLIIMGDQESYNKTRNMFNLKTSYLSQNS